MKNLLDTPEFRNWFRDSKMVDGEGRPLRLFHGTRSDVHTFDASKSGEFGPGIYLTDFEGTADYYASSVARGDHGPNIMPLYASIQNPFTVTKQQWVKMTTNSTPRTVQKRLMAKGHDGIIGIGINGMDRQIVAFRADQVKSAISNKGAFDGSKSDITEGLRHYIDIVEAVSKTRLVNDDAVEHRHEPPLQRPVVRPEGRGAQERQGQPRDLPRALFRREE